MSLLFPLYKKRQITGANHNYYRTGILHPDRIMQEHDLIYLVEGEFEIRQGGDAFLMRPDDVLILWSGLHHYSVKKCREKTKTMYIHFSTEEGDTYGAAETKKDCVLLPSFLSCRGNEKIKLRMQELISVFFRAGSFDHKLHLLLDLLLSDLAEQAAPASHAKDELIEKLILHMQSVPHKFFTAKEFGELFNIGERTLWNRFKNACHQTIYQYQMDLKLKMIHSYICENVEATAFEIAQNYGFYDEFHLSKHFKKHFGYTVSHLRARIGHK